MRSIVWGSRYAVDEDALKHKLTLFGRKLLLKSCFSVAKHLAMVKSSGFRVVEGAAPLPIIRKFFIEF